MELKRLTMQLKGLIPLGVKNRLYEIQQSPVKTACWLFGLAFVVVALLTYYSGLYGPDSVVGFGKNVLVEAHGMLFDILVFGVLILWFHERGKKQIVNQRYEDEIDDFRGWESPEAAHRIRGNIKRLNRNGITRINLTNCYLEDINLMGATLQKALLTEAVLSEANVEKASFQQADLMSAEFVKANCWHTDFRQASLRHANLHGASCVRSDFRASDLRMARLNLADMRDAKFQGADLDSATFFETDLGRANLYGVKNLTAEQLSTARSLYEAKLDSELMEQVKKKRPELFEKPPDE